jgi:hypothetical protein
MAARAVLVAHMNAESAAEYAARRRERKARGFALRDTQALEKADTMEEVTAWCISGTDLCARSEVWAAWVQGVGSVAAIIAAVWIAWWQRQQDLRRSELNAREETYRAIQVGMFYSGKLLWCLQDHVDACAARDRRALDESRAVLRDIATWASSVQVERLPFNALAAFFAARRIATVAQQRWTELETDESADYDYWRGVFDKLREEADDALAKLFDERTALDDSSRGRLPAKDATRNLVS